MVDVFGMNIKMFIILHDAFSLLLFVDVYVVYLAREVYSNIENSRARTGCDRWILRQIFIWF